MAKQAIKKGTTSKRIGVFIQDSSKTTGEGLTGLLFSSSGLTWHYWRENEGNVGGTSVTLATATRGTYASGGFIEKDATNLRGFYEIGIPNAALATGAGWVVMELKGATNMAELTLEIQLTDNTVKDVFDEVTHASYGLDQLVRSTTPANTLDVSATGEAGIDWANIGSPTTAVDLSGTDIQLCDTTTTLTGHTVQTGDNFARLGAPAGVSVSADVAAIKAETVLIVADTNELQTDDIPTLIAAVQSDTDNIQTRLPAALVGGKMDSVAILADGAHGGTSAVLTLERIIAISTTAGEPAFKLTGNTTAAGLLSTGGATGAGANFVGGVSGGNGFLTQANGGNGNGFRSVGDGSGRGIRAEGGPTGAGIHGLGGGTSGDGIAGTVTSGNEFSGSLSGSVNSVVTDVGITQAAADKAWATTVRTITGGTITTVNDKTGYTLTSAEQDAIVDKVWDEVLTGATHNVVNSSGRRLRQLEAASVITSGTAQAGTATTITLAAGESSTSNIFNGDRVIIVGGTGVGEHGIITAYDGSTKIATMSRNWVITPDVTSEYDLVPADVDIETIEHSVVAADNLMADYDGTGYAKANSTIGTATNLTTNNDKTGYSISGAKTTLDALNDLSQAQILSDATPFSGANINNLPEGITKNAAFNDFPFAMYDDTDGRTAKTGLSITAQRSIDGGAFVAADGTVAEIGNGMYVIDLLAADTNGDSIIYRFTGTNADPTVISIKTSS